MAAGAVASARVGRAGLGVGRGRHLPFRTLSSPLSVRVGVSLCRPLWLSPAREQSFSSGSRRAGPGEEAGWDVGGTVSAARSSNRCDWAWLFALAAYTLSSGAGTPSGCCPPGLVGSPEEPWIELSRVKIQKAWKPGMRGAGSLSKWLLCGELSVPPKLTSGLLSEDLLHRLFPLRAAVLKE